MEARHPFVEQQQILASQDPLADDRFTSSMAGGGRRMIKTAETPGSGAYGAYRVPGDTSFTRYERMSSGQGFWWRALATDGTKYFFGGATAACSNVGERYAPITKIVDSFGGEIVFEYSMANEECRIDQIEYGGNGTIAPHARIDFTYAAATACNGIYAGARIDYRTGTKIVTGTARLTRITAVALSEGGTPVHTREIDLGYDTTSESCTLAAHSPIRLLTSIDERAWGIDSPLVDLPAVTFQYAPPGVSLTQGNQRTGAPWITTSPPPQPPAQPLYGESLAWGYRFDSSERWPTLEATLVDVDGDGIPDRLRSGIAGDSSRCQAFWDRNTGTMVGGFPQFEAPRTISLPRLRWANGTPTTFGTINTSIGESCSVNGQRTLYENNASFTGGDPTYVLRATIVTV
jgi:hypothetical protein